MAMTSIPNDLGFKQIAYDVHRIFGDYSDVTNIASAQTVTTNYAVIGDEVDVSGANRVITFMKYDSATGGTATITMTGAYESSGSQYEIDGLSDITLASTCLKTKELDVKGVKYITFKIKNVSGGGFITMDVVPLFKP